MEFAGICKKINGNKAYLFTKPISHTNPKTKHDYLHKFTSYEENAQEVYESVLKIIEEHDWYSQFYSKHLFATPAHFQYINDSFHTLLENKKTFPFVADAIHAIVIDHYRHLYVNMSHYILDLLDRNQSINLLTHHHTTDMTQCNLILHPHGLGFKYCTHKEKYGYTFLSRTYSMISISQIHTMHEWDVETRLKCTHFLSNVFGGYFINPAVVFLSTTLYETVPILMAKRDNFKIITQISRKGGKKQKKLSENNNLV
jgi:hypothetical protein